MLNLVKIIFSLRDEKLIDTTSAQMMKGRPRILKRIFLLALRNICNYNTLPEPSLPPAKTDIFIDSICYYVYFMEIEGLIIKKCLCKMN
jgi:hypothetical protein